MLVCQTQISVEGPAVEAAEAGQQTEARSRQQRLDQGWLKLPVAEAYHVLRPRGTALLVEGLIVEAHVENAPTWVEAVVVGVDQPLPGNRVAEQGAAPAAQRIALDPRWIRRQDVERQPASGNQTGTRGSQKMLKIGLPIQVLHAVEGGHCQGEAWSQGKGAQVRPQEQAARAAGGRQARDPAPSRGQHGRRAIQPEHRVPVAQQGQQQPSRAASEIQDGAGRREVRAVLGQASVEIDVSAAAAVLEIVQRGVGEGLATTRFFIGA